MQERKKAIIIGGGPAGLTAALEFLNKTDIQPIIIESSKYWGGISRTVNYKGNRIDIGGHRFFSKSDIIMKWWTDILPIEKLNDKKTVVISYQNQSKSILSGDIEAELVNNVMLIRNRKSRIYYLKSFFNYPISLSFETIKNLGIIRILKIGFSFIKASIKPIKPEKNLEEFFINRFGKELYQTFFKDYTEKVWGITCNKISAEWGAQRIKGLNITKAVHHFLNSIFNHKKDITQKNTETSLIEFFMYPKYGPGQLWEEVANQIEKKGGLLYQQIHINTINIEGKMVKSISGRDENGDIIEFEGDFFLSTMPVKDLLNGFNIEVPKEILEVGNGLIYRDFITVGLLLEKLLVGNISDNWIYIQEPEVKVGRLQIFNNWSPYLVNDPSKIWVGMEYFCNENDALYNLSESEMKDFAIKELEQIKIIDSKDVLDGVVIKMPKTYPAYFGTYNEFDRIINYVNQFENLFLIGRNGMHKYNNQDHSMLTAIKAVENISKGITSKDNIWQINTEQDYHESK